MRALLLALTLPAALAAQQPADSSPAAREFAAALARFPGYARRTPPNLQKAPDNFPKELLPPGAAILGSYSDRVFLSTPDSIAAVAEKLREQVSAFGWTPLPEFPSRSYRDREVGFQSGEPRRESVNAPTSFNMCKDDMSMWFNATPRGGGGSYVAVTVQATSVQSRCDPANTERLVEEMRNAPPDLPTLYPPTGLKSVGGSGYGGNGLGNTASATYEGPTVYTDSVMFAFQAQLREQGWSGFQIQGGGEAASLTATKKGPRNRDILLMIVDMRSSKRVHFITLQTVIVR